MHVVGIAPALEPAGALAYSPQVAETHVVTGIDVRGLTRDRRSGTTSYPAARCFLKLELTEDGRFLDEVDAEGNERARAEERRPVIVDLGLLGIRLKGGDR